MSTLHLVDPELRPLLAMMPTADFTADTLAAARERMTQMLAMAPPPAIVPRFVAAPGPDGEAEVPIRLFEPPADGLRPAILHIHGGGFVAGSAAMNDTQNAARALAHDAVVASVDYRLAPETPFPGPLEDCFAALEWLLTHAEALCVDPARIVVMGESAGGGLAAALSLLARDRGIVLAGQLLVYPMLDHQTGESGKGNPSVGEFVWTPGSNRFGWGAMRGGQSVEADRLGYFSPAHAADLGNLARAAILVGALDLFLDEDVAYAMRLSHAGVPVELHVYPGCYHGFDLVADAAAAKRMTADIGSALARLLA